MRQVAEIADAFNTYIEEYVEANGVDNVVISVTDAKGDAI